MEVARELQWTWERAGWTFIFPEYPTLWSHSIDYVIPNDHPDTIFDESRNT